MMCGVRIGICSWTDKTLLKSGFYPRSASTPAARLAFYASRFDTVEVDSTYYALPDPGNVFRWIAGTPKHFTFGVKSYALFTFHRAKFASLPKWLREELGPRETGSYIRRDEVSHEQRKKLFDEFVSSVRMLHRAGRLAYLLFQFPPTFRFSREGLIYFKRLREVSGPMPLAVEVRSGTWFAARNRARFLRALQDQNIAYTAVDEPALGWTVRPDWPETSEWGTLVRFHGRNRAGWANPRANVYERFDYQYNRAELNEWLPRIEEKISAMNETREICDRKIYLMYNNCVGDKAVQSAVLMKEMLGLDTPSPEGRQRTLDF